MNDTERGFTFTEQLLSLAISALIALGAAMASAQVIRSTARNNDWNTAFRQAQNVGYWVSQDGIMAQDVDIGDDPGTDDVEFITLLWKDWETGETYDTSYVWSGGELRRRQVIRDSGGVEVDNRMVLVATNILAADLSSSGSGWKLSVETRSGDREVTREYEIGRRLQE